MLVEPDDLGACAVPEPKDDLIPTVQNREIVRSRELDSACLEVDVALKRVVAVEVVGRDVEDHADVQPRSLD